MPGNCIFNILWLTKDSYKTWLSSTTNRHKAKCIVCAKEFDVGRMGESAVKAHMKGQRHMALVEENKFSNQIITFCKDSASTKSVTCIQATEVPASTSSTFHYISNKGALDAEILWVLKCINNHYSYNSCQGIKELFAKMFPDSVIAKQFSLGDKKCSYLCNFGLAPHFKTLLLANLDNASHFTLLFDETLNKSTQTKQLDIFVRYWNAEENQVCTRYLTSAFIGHATATDILREFYSAVEKLHLSKLIQISMDGPSVNWSFYDSLQKDLLQQYNCHCASVGTCGLHVMNNAFRKGALSTDWDIAAILTSLYWLFKDSPARRDDFLQISQLKKLPAKYCNYRWLENVSSTEKAILIWDDVRQYVKHVEIGKFNKVNSKSFRIVAEATKDKMLPMKLQFFLSVSKLLQPFLETYQSDKPLLPFFAEDTFNLIKHYLKLYNVIKIESLNGILSVEKLIKYNFEDKKSYSSVTKISAGFVADKMIKESLHKREISDSSVLAFRYACQIFIIKMTQSLLLKCPINYTLVRNSACVDPRLMVQDTAKCCNKMKRVLLDLSNINHVKDEDCDGILLEYKDFMENVVKKSPSEFGKFDIIKMRLDTFLFPYFSQGKFPKVWEIMKLLMIFSHGQASVERGFSINKNIEVENLKDTSYVSQRIIYDHIKLYGNILDIVITDDMRKAASSARMKYEHYLMEQRKSRNNLTSQNKRKLILDEIGDLKSKKSCLQIDIVELESSADILAEKAEVEIDPTFSKNLFIRSNNFRKSIKGKTDEISDLENKIEEKKIQLKRI